MCNFRNRIESTDIMWKFKMGDVERIINPPEGGILSPFRHEFLQLNNSINVQSVSKLKIYLVNSSYYTNYTLMNTRDSCQIKSRLHLQERGKSSLDPPSLYSYLNINPFFSLLVALMYTNSSTRPGSQSLITAVLLSLFLCEIVCLNWFTNIRF